MALRDWSEFGADPLAFPYRGTIYEVPEVDMDLGARLTVEMSDPESDFNSLPIDEMWRTIFGDELYDRLRADRVPVRVVSRMFVSCLADFQLGREAAEATWEAGLDPKALADRMAQATGLLPTPSSSTDEAITTP